MSDDFDIRLAAAALLVATAGWLWGQFAVNSQFNNVVYSGGAGGSVRYAGVNPSVAAITSTPMESEVRDAYWQSGATPSEIRMNYASIGPMAQGGPLAYIGGSAPAPKPGPAPIPAPMSLGSIRYSAGSPAPTSALVTPAPLSSGYVPARVSTGPITPGPVNYGTIRYGR